MIHLTKIFNSYDARFQAQINLLFHQRKNVLSDFKTLNRSYFSWYISFAVKMSMGSFSKFICLVAAPHSHKHRRTTNFIFEWVYSMLQPVNSSSTS